MALSEINRNAVLHEVAEFDELGRDAFLAYPPNQDVGSSKAARRGTKSSAGSAVSAFGVGKHLAPIYAATSGNAAQGWGV